MDRLGKLNKNFLIVPKILYLSLSASFYTFHQFRGQFIIERYNVEKSSLGFYLSVPQFISFFSNLYIGAINDKSGKQKLLILTLLVASAVFFQTFFQDLSLFMFWVNYTIYFALISATLPLMDKVMLDYVAGIPEMGAKAFGSQRIWSTFGYLLTNFSVEHIIATSDPDVQDFDKMRYFNMFVAALAGILIFMFVNNLPQRTSTSNYLSSMRSLLFNFEYMYFIFIILLCGISRAFMTNYLGVYYSKVLKFNDQENTLSLFWPLNKLADIGYNHKQSTSTFFGVALEIIIFYNSSLVTDKLGLLWPIFLSQIFQLLRFICYYRLSYDDPNSFAYCCLTELLKGANYSLIHTSALQLANSFSPPHLRTTSQLIYNGTFVAIGTVASGLFFKSYFSKSIDDVEESYSEFHSAFKANIVFSLIGIGFFLAKYAVHENLLFNRTNMERKLRIIEDQALEEDAEYQQGETEVK